MDLEHQKLTHKSYSKKRQQHFREQVKETLGWKPWQNIAESLSLERLWLGGILEPTGQLCITSIGASDNQGLGTPVSPGTEL